MAAVCDWPTVSQGNPLAELGRFCAWTDLAKEFKVFRVGTIRRCFSSCDLFLKTDAISSEEVTSRNILIFCLFFVLFNHRSIPACLVILFRVGLGM